VEQRVGPGRRWREVKTIAFLTLDSLFWSRKTLLVVLIALLILGLSVLGRLAYSYHWVRVPPTPSQVFSTLVSTTVLHFLVVFVTLFYGTALISDEVEGKTLTYLFLRPVPKPAILLGKYLALVWIGALMVVPTVFLSYLILYLQVDLGPFIEDAGVLAQDVGILLLAVLAYGGLFTFLGAWLKHSILAGLLYAFGWEGIVSYLPGATRKLTITHYLQSIFPHTDRAAALAMLIGSRTETFEAILTLVLLTGLLVSASALLVREKEYVLEQ
jgi:ABC-type transport system involved in multi-copper enzyme maturation permease subunit